jgi:cell division septation protein DedD
MAARSRRRRPQKGAPGWIQTLVGAVLLLALGFGVGLVAGGALEDPRLVARHVAGETVEVPLPGEGEEPDVASGDPAPAAPQEATAQEGGERPLGAPASEAAPVPTPKSAAPIAAQAAPAGPLETPVALPESAPRTGFSVQVGAFAEESGANQLADRLRAAGFGAYVVEVDTAGRAGAAFRVRVGPFPTRDAASAEAARLHAEQRLPTWVQAEEGA